MATLTVQIPDALADALAVYLARTGGSAGPAVTEALALWLIGKGHGSRALNRAYLDAAFPGCSGADAA